MKTTILLTLFLLSTVLVAFGQPSRPAMGKEMQQVQINYLTSRLHLKGDKAARFKAIYCDYLDQSADRRRGFGQSDTTAMTNAQAEELIKAEFEGAQKSLDLREEYYNRFREVLSPVEIYKMYRYEREMRFRVGQEIERRSGDQSMQNNPNCDNNENTKGRR